MFGLSAEAEGASKKLPFYQLKEQIEKQIPDEEILLEEKYTLHPIKGHRLKITTYAKNRNTGKITELAVNWVKIPQHVPKWITQKDLWHHTKEELEVLEKLAQAKNEKSPSKQTLEQWHNILKDNVRKTHNNTKQIPIPSIR